MGIKGIIDDSKSRLDALLTYANGVTGATDVSIGDAIKTLADGYGQGGDDANTIRRTIVISEDITSTSTITAYEDAADAEYINFMRGHFYSTQLRIVETVIVPESLSEVQGAFNGAFIMRPTIRNTGIMNLTLSSVIGYRSASGMITYRITAGNGLVVPSSDEKINSFKVTARCDAYVTVIPAGTYNITIRDLTPDLYR